LLACHEVRFFRSKPIANGTKFTLKKEKSSGTRNCKLYDVYTKKSEEFRAHPRVRETALSGFKQLFNLAPAGSVPFAA
jgi:uncharacterized protein YodC (DUF2158 family)